MTSPNETQGPKRMAEILRRAMANPLYRMGTAERAAVEAERKREEATQQARHALLQADLWPDHLRRCGAPSEAVAALTGDALRETPAVMAARAFLEGSARFLVLGGKTGAGKTVAACSVFRHALRRETRTGYDFLEWDGEGGLFLRLFALTRLSDFDARDRATLRKACDARVLVLDEVQRAGAGEPLPPRAQEWFDEVVDARDAAHKRTVLTTNLSVHRDAPDAERLSVFIRERAQSRIARSCMTRDCGPVDLRRGGGAK